MQLHEYADHITIIKKAIAEIIETKATKDAIRNVFGYFPGGTITKEELIESIKAECDRAKGSLDDKETLLLIEQFGADVEKAIENYIATLG